MKKVIFDVDTGSDDALALIYGLLNKNIDCLGITTVFGNSSVEETTEHTLQVLSLIKKNIPVYKGCHKALVSEVYDDGTPYGVIKNKAKDENGQVIGFHEVFAGLENHLSYQKEHAVTFLTSILKKSQEKVTIIASGALTNIAMTLRLVPEVKNNIERIIIMGGGIELSNKTAYSEGNFFRDPEAAKIVLESGVDIILLPLDITTDMYLTTNHLNYFKNSADQIKQFIGKVIEMRMKAYNILQPQAVSDVAIVHDLLCTFALLNEEVIKDYLLCPATVCIDHNEACGKLLVDKRKVSNNRDIKIGLKVNKELYETMLYSL